MSEAREHPRCPDCGGTNTWVTYTIGGYMAFCDNDECLAFWPWSTRDRQQAREEKEADDE